MRPSAVDKFFHLPSQYIDISVLIRDSLHAHNLRPQTAFAWMSNVIQRNTNTQKRQQKQNSYVSTSNINGLIFKCLGSNGQRSERYRLEQLRIITLWQKKLDERLKSAKKLRVAMGQKSSSKYK